ncbi:TonB family protein [Modicisalibacter xianhensis]|uniref:TonB family protein n=1 Tax=Modicisalibacter xianhensis TaxID=442341 RepID=A0A4R8FTQ5_9GAMM|nr:TonB family protein [Halomonas xianhensis]TDX26817.1 TonB family protein [Halomonas xianhensis]
MNRTTLVLLTGGLSAIGAVAVWTGYGNEVSEKAIGQIESPKVEDLVSLFEPNESIESKGESRYPLLPIPPAPGHEQETSAADAPPLDTIDPDVSSYHDTAEPRYLDGLSKQQSASESSEAVSPEQMQAVLDGLVAEGSAPNVLTEQGMDIPEATSSKVPGKASIDETPADVSPELQEAIQVIGVRVGQHWRVPPSEIQRHGAIVTLALDAQGEIVQATISRSSGHELYDQSVINAARDAAPFEEVMALPDGVRQQLAKFNLTFGSLAAIEAHEAQTQQAAVMQQQVHEPQEHAEEQAYLLGVKQRIGKAWVIPDGITIPHEMTVIAGLAAPFGTVSKAEVLRSSGDTALDESIVRAVRQAGPFSEMRNMPLADQQALAEFRVRFLPTGEVL